MVLILDLDCNPHCLNGQAAFRRNVLIQRRRVASKALNDGARRRGELLILP
jgi:hypothetical protein